MLLKNVTLAESNNDISLNWSQALNKKELPEVQPSKLQQDAGEALVYASFYVG